MSNSHFKSGRGSCDNGSCGFKKNNRRCAPPCATPCGISSPCGPFNGGGACGPFNGGGGCAPCGPFNGGGGCAPCGPFNGGGACAPCGPFNGGGVGGPCGPFNGGPCGPFPGPCAPLAPCAPACGPPPCLALPDERKVIRLRTKLCPFVLPPCENSICLDGSRSLSSADCCIPQGSGFGEFTLEISRFHQVPQLVFRVFTSKTSSNVIRVRLYRACKLGSFNGQPVINLSKIYRKNTECANLNGEIQGSVPISNLLAQDLLQGLLYVRVDSCNFPAGEQAGFITCCP